VSVPLSVSGPLLRRSGVAGIFARTSNKGLRGIPGRPVSR
jgi:hypothetical protein